MQDNINRRSTISGVTGLGLILIVAGVIFLVAQEVPFDFGQYAWPLYVILFGAAFLFIGLATPASGFVIPGSIVTTAGLIFAVQNAFDLWATWSYAWALMFPFSIGIGVALLGMQMHNPAQVRTGTGIAATGIGLFLVFGAFFEGIVHVSGYDLGSVGDLLVAFVLIASGVILIVLRMASSEGGTNPGANP